MICLIFCYFFEIYKYLVINMSMILCIFLAVPFSLFSIAIVCAKINWIHRLNLSRLGKAVLCFYFKFLMKWPLLSLHFIYSFHLGAFFADCCCSLRHAQIHVHVLCPCRASRSKLLCSVWIFHLIFFGYAAAALLL